MAIRKRQDVPSVDGDRVVLKPGKWAKDYPHLWEFLHMETYEDGTARRLPTITLFVSPTGLQACLNDRDQSMAAFVTGESLEALWAALEGGLSMDSLDWRRSSPPPQKKRGR